MRNILIISPLYQINGRKDIKTDTQCVHDLVKYWSNNNNVKVVVPYARGVKKLKTFLNKEQLNYFFKGYNYKCDNIDILLVETQNVIKGQDEGFKIDVLKETKIIKNHLKKDYFTPDVIAVHVPSVSKKLIFNLRFKDAPKIAILHYTDVLYLEKKKEKYIKYLEKTFSNVYCRSEAIYKVFYEAKLKNLSHDIVYSGAPKNQEKIDINQKFKNKKHKILYVGKLIERKKLDYLIESLTSFEKEKCELYVIGDGPMLEKYQKLVKKLKLEKQVKFLGTMPKEKVFQYMREADIFCMPSIRETLGLVYIEAMAQGCITIGTKDEGVDGIIKNEKNGFLINPTVADVTKVLEKIFSLKKEELRKIIKNAIETANTFNEESMSECYYKKIEKELK